MPSAGPRDSWTSLSTLEDARWSAGRQVQSLLSGSRTVAPPCPVRVLLGPQLTPGCGVEASTHRVKVEQPVAPSHWLGHGYQAGTNLPLSLWPGVQEQVSGLMLLRACVCVFMCMCVCAGELCRCESAIVYARVCAPRLPAPMTALGSSGGACSTLSSAVITEHLARTLHRDGHGGRRQGPRQAHPSSWDRQTVVKSWR